MAKKNIHPDYHVVIIKTTKGEEFKTKSCFGKENSVIALEIDINNHPAWKTGDQTFVNENDDQVAKFYKKYKGFKN